MQTILPISMYHMPSVQQMKINQLPPLNTKIPMSKRIKANESKPQKCKVSENPKQQLKPQIGQMKQQIIMNQQIGAIQNLPSIPRYCPQPVGLNQLQQTNLPCIARTPISQSISASTSPQPPRKKVPVKPRQHPKLPEINLINRGMKNITRTNINNRINEWIKGTDQESELPYFWFL